MLGKEQYESLEEYLEEFLINFKNGKYKVIVDNNSEYNPYLLRAKSLLREGAFIEGINTYIECIKNSGADIHVLIEFSKAIICMNDFKSAGILIMFINELCDKFKLRNTDSPNWIANTFTTTMINYQMSSNNDFLLKYIRELTNDSVYNFVLPIEMIQENILMFVSSIRDIVSMVIHSKLMEETIVIPHVN